VPWKIELPGALCHYIQIVMDASKVEFVVVSNLSGDPCDPWEDAVCTSEEEARAWIERLVERSASPPYISAEEWRSLFWIEERQVSDLA